MVSQLEVSIACCFYGRGRTLKESTQTAGRLTVDLEPYELIFRLNQKEKRYQLFAIDLIL